MFRYKTNKQALIIAALVILLCLTCLTGATLALFTSNQNDGTIDVITTAGNLGVDIVDPISNESLVGKVLKFQPKSSESVILFEPGATYYTQGFQIKNTGDIPINFRLFVSRDDSIDATAFHEAFEVWISTSPTKPENATLLSEFLGRLEVGASSTDTYYLFIKMKETAENDFQEQEYDGIGITVYAVQGNVSAQEE